MKKLTKIMSLMLVLAMVLSLFAGCGAKAPAEGNAPAAEAPAAEAPAAEEDKTLVVAIQNFDGKFSPFFYTNSYENEVLELVHLPLLGTDREGSPVLKGIEGEVRPYNGTDYTYDGIADCVITENADGTVYYDFTLKDGILFSDGHEMDIDDVIFSLYVPLDPTYDGIMTLYSLPIQGLDAYRSGMAAKMDLIASVNYEGYEAAAAEAKAEYDALVAAAETAAADAAKLAEDPEADADAIAEAEAAAETAAAEAEAAIIATDFFTEEEYNTFWAAFWTATETMAQEIVDYCVEAGYATDSNDAAGAAAGWNIPGVEEGATVADFAKAIAALYDYSVADMDAESANTSLVAMFEAEMGDALADMKAGVQTGKSAPNVSGIQKTGDNSLRIEMYELSAKAIYTLATSIVPMHYYGEESLYDYENNMFGFTKGDLSDVKSVTTHPMGAGPYKFVSYENSTVTLEANDKYMKGCPKTKFILFKESQDADKIPGVSTGTIDITDPSYSTENANAISDINGGTLTGDVITTNMVANLGYGYVGFCAKNVNVGGEYGSEASKNLRKAIATVISVYRDVAVDSYYGEFANVINYPISDTSWAAPRVTDEGYKIAFSTAVDGTPIYTEGMTADEKYAAAQAAALAYFEAAGYTVADGKVTAAPEGASMNYEVLVGGGGTGDHPTFMALTMAAASLKEIGFELIVTDMSNFSELTNSVNSGTAEIYAMAWNATPDPDMYQIYHSEGSSNEKSYWIKDAELDELIVMAVRSTDQTYRKTLYKEALDIVADWAVEIPIYQRQNVIIFSTERVNIDTVTPDITTFWGWKNDIEKLEMK